MQLKTYNIFISHAWKHNKAYYRLIEYLQAAPYFYFKNFSVPQHNPKDGNLSEALKRQMRQAQVILILAGMYANYSSWIEFEVEFATQLGKPIIGIRPWASQRTPRYIENIADEMVGWNTASIVNAIRRRA